MRGLEAATWEALDRRLRHGGSRPVAVALSGGGDSLALTLITDQWARARGRNLLVLTVDHGLRPESAAWTTACARAADRLGRPFQALRWDGEKPSRGLPAAARAARHALLAQAARDAGAQVILMGHTADDRAEGVAMRAAGSTAPDPREWSPSPAWPEGRGLFLCRPLLTARRGDLRTWLEARGEPWIDDPANTDTRFARARARCDAPPAPPLAAECPLWLADQAQEGAGVVSLPREVLLGAPTDDALRLLALAAVCAGGHARIPARAQTARILTALRAAGPVTATLSGARTIADSVTIYIHREAGEAGRGGLSPIPAPGVWDGRFEIEGPGQVRRLQGLAAQLPADQQAALRRLPPSARGALPALIGPDGAVTCPALAGAPSLVGPRLRAAAGLIQREPA